MNNNALTQHIHTTLLARFTTSEHKRDEALHAVLSLQHPGLNLHKTKELAACIPTLPQSIYTRWIELFCESLLATATPEQLADMCSGKESGNAVLTLVFLMFLESERMERIIAQDLHSIQQERSYQQDTTVPH